MFLKDFNWLHLVSTLAGHEFLQMEKVIESNVEDVFSYLIYMKAKSSAEKAQNKLEDKLRK